MSTDFNPPSKFAEGQKIKVNTGYHAGKSGKITSISGLGNLRIGHGTFDMLNDESVFFYEVSVGFFRTIYVTENQIESL